MAMSLARRFQDLPPAARAATVLGLIVALLFGVSFARAQTVSHLEDFTGVAGRDCLRTSAHWNVEAGALELHHFEIERRARVALEAVARDLVVAGTRAFVSTSQATHVVDLRAAGGPAAIATVDVGGEGLDFAMGHLFLADPDGFLHVVDVRDAVSPNAVARLEGLVAPTDVVVIGSFALVADANGLRVIDVRDPEAPVVVASLDLGVAVRRLEVDGGWAYLALGEEGLACVDVRDPHALRLAARLDTGSPVAACAADGNRLYLAEGSARRLRVLNVSDPADPASITSHALAGDALDLQVTGNWVHLAGPGGVEIVDVSDPAAPRTHGAGGMAARAIHVAGTTAYTAGDGGLELLWVADLVEPLAPTSRAETPDQAYEVQIAGDYAFVPDYSTGLLIFDLRDPDDIAWVATHDTPGSAVDVALAADVAYVADHSVGGIQVVDVSRPRQPRRLGSLDTPAAAVAIEVAADLLCVGFINGGLTTYDVSNPGAPRRLGSIAAGSIRDIALDGSLAFLADNTDGLDVVDLSDPTAPCLLASRPAAGRPSGIAYSGSHVFLANGLGRVQVFDVTRPEDPFWISEGVTVGFPFKIDVVGEHVFVADHVAGGMQVLDVSDPTRPQLVSGHVTGFYADGVTIAGDHALLSDGQGLQVLRAFDRRPYVDREGDRAQSIALSPAGEAVVLASLRTQQQGEIRWRLHTATTAGGQEVLPDGAWIALDSVGDSLRWEAVLESEDARCTELELRWRTEAPVLDELAVVSSAKESITPLRLRWIRSGYDVVGGALDEYVVERLEGTRWRPVAEISARAEDAYEVLVDGPRDGGLAGPAHYRVVARAEDGRSFASRVRTWSPSSFWLGKSYPNPFRSSTAILYDVPVEGEVVELRILDLRGRRVRTLAQGAHPQGRHRRQWEGRDEAGRRVASGVYFYELVAPGVRHTGRMLLVD